MRNLRWILPLLLLIITVTGVSAQEKNFVVGDKMKVTLGGRYRVCTVEALQPGKVKIHFEDDETLYDRWVPEAIVENYTYSKGDIILVSREGKWLPAKVLAGGTLTYKITYIGMETKFDEWVGPERIKEVKYKAGDTVTVYWNNDWYRAKILRYELGKYQVHYEGFPDSYDEWVTVDRIRK